MLRTSLFTTIKLHTPFLLLSGIFFLSRLFFLGTDWHVLEPDEGLHTGLAAEFMAGRWPLFRGHLFLEMFPLFHLTSGLLQRMFGAWGPFVGGRLLAVFGSFVIGLILYRYGRYRLNVTAGLVSAMIFWLLPLSFFYSRSGTIEMFYLGLGVASLGLWLKAGIQTNSRSALLAGICFALAIMAKTSASFLLLSFVILILWEPKRYVLVLKSFLFGLLGILIPVFGVFWWYFQTEFTSQAYDLPAKHLLPLFNVTVHLAVWREYLTRLAWFLSWPGVIGLAGGVLILCHEMWARRVELMAYLKKLGKTWQHFELKPTRSIWLKMLTFFRKQPAYQSEYLSRFGELSAWVIPPLLFVALFDFSPRYFVLLTPSIALLIAWGLSQLRWPRVRWLAVLSVIPFTYQAWQGTLHTQLAEVRQVVLEYDMNLSQPPIYSTFEPDKLSYYLGRPVRWLNQEVKSTGGIVIVDIRKTELMTNLSEPEFREMKAVLGTLDREHHLVARFTDPTNHYPVDLRPNRFEVFAVPESK